MICKISRGEKPKRLMTYLFRPSCFSKVFDSSGQTPAEYTAMFNRHNAFRPDIKRPIYHLSVRLDEHIYPTDEEFHKLGLDVLEKMGLGTNRPFLIVKHNYEKEEPGTHIHIVTSRIDYDSRVWYGRNDAKQAIAISRELGRPENFLFKDETVAPRVWQSGPSGRPAYTHAETQQAGRTKEWLPREQVALGVALALRSVPRKGQEPLNKEFVKACQEHGITPKIYTRANGRQGLVYEFEGKDYASSKLGRAYTLAGLKKHFASDHDLPAIELPKSRKDSLRSKVKAIGEELPEKDRKEKQPIPCDNIYKMAKELENCEFEDLRHVGSMIQLQLDFKIMKKDTLGYMTCYASLNIQDLENRREHARHLAKLRPQLIVLRPEELDCTDEYYTRQVYPRIFKHGTDSERGPLVDSNANNQRNRKKGYILQIINRNRATDDMKFTLAAEDYEIAVEDLKKREAAFYKLPDFLKVFAPKHRGPDPEEPDPKKFFKGDKLKDERGLGWMNDISKKFTEIAEYERGMGREIDAREVNKSKERELERKRRDEEQQREEADRQEREAQERRKAEERAREELEIQATAPLPAEPTPAPFVKPTRAPRPSGPSRGRGRPRDRGVDR